MTQRMEARVAGCSYLVYILVAMSSSILYGRATAGESVSQTLSTLSRTIWTARGTVLLDLLEPVCALVLAVTSYRLVRAVDPTLALLAMLFRVGEGLLGSLPVLGKLELMRLATTLPAGGAYAVDDLSLAKEILHRPDEVFSEFCFVVGGFLLSVSPWALDPARAGVDRCHHHRRADGLRATTHRHHDPWFDRELDVVSDPAL